MNSLYRWETLATVAQDHVVAIVRAPDADAARARCHLLLNAGVRVLEVSLTTPGALGVIEALRGTQDAVIGAGTVLDPESACLVALAGGSFIVAPNLEPAVLATAHRYGMAAFPGAGTATEAVRALEAGADAVKLFPAAAVGLAGMQALLEPLPQLALIPTGGVPIDAVPQWIAAGALAVGLGSGLARLAEQGPEAVAALLARLR